MGHLCVRTEVIRFLRQIIQIWDFPYDSRRSVSLQEEKKMEGTPETVKCKRYNMLALISERLLLFQNVCSRLDLRLSV